MDQGLSPKRGVGAALRAALGVEAETLHLQRPELSLVGLIMDANTAEAEAFAWARDLIFEQRTEGPWVSALVTHSCAREIARTVSPNVADTLERLLIESRGQGVKLPILVIRPPDRGSDPLLR